jgi:mono/diheme cytochrome c family protein
MDSFSKALVKGSWNAALLFTVCLTFSLSYSPKAVAEDSAEDLYGHKCAICHGKDGSGNTAKGKKVHVKDVHANMKDSEDDMIKIVTDGKGDDMDSYKGELTATQIKALVDYYRSLGQK